MNTHRRTASTLALLGAGMLLLAGCVGTTGSMTPPAATPGSGNESAPVSSELEVDAGWLGGGALIALVTEGSSSCVPAASDVAVQADGSIAVTLTDPEGVPCTRDLVPRASVVALPDGVDAGQDLDIVVTYGDARGETDLDAYTGGAVDEYTPSAGWVDDDMFAILTWGSSSCPPVVESVTVDGPAAVTVTFATPPADQVCTMDVAPRVTLVTADGADDDNAMVTLTGGPEFETAVTIPIVEN